MKNRINAYGAIVIAATLATPAMAQVAGTYAGTSADGSGISFVVGTDVGTGELAVTAANIFFTAPCKNSTYVLNTGWGFGANADISRAGKVTFASNGNYFSFHVTLDFSADGQSATGSITSASPTLTPVGPKPTHSLFCSSPKQTLSLTLQPSSSAAQATINQLNPRLNADSSVEVSH